MSALLRAELLKHHTTAPALLAGLLGLVGFAVLMHALSLTERGAAGLENQLTFVLGWGEVMGALFAGLAGALSFTGEYRHGTIRPTFLVTPRRGRVIAAKLVAGALLGAAFGLLASVLAVGAGSAVLAARGIQVMAGHDDIVLLLAGGTLAAGLWGAVGVGVGALARRQVPVIVGLAVWLLFVENLLVGFVPEVGRLAPGAAGGALAGLNPGTLVAPAAGALLLSLWAAGAVVAGWIATVRHDV
jgi:ABC-type transport system involved in multi-copper enzyme maturation permease subunit